MKTRKLIATVIDSGGCKHYTKGTTFTLNEHRPECMCETGYRGLSVMAKGILNAPRLPGIDNDTMITRCPYHTDGAVWELRIEEID